MHIWQHFKTITSHKLLVMRYCFRIGLYRQGLATRPVQVFLDRVFQRMQVLAGKQEPQQRGERGHRSFPGLAPSQGKK